jgi:hypothetical protein
VEDEYPQCSLFGIYFKPIISSSKRPDRYNSTMSRTRLSTIRIRHLHSFHQLVNIRHTRKHVGQAGQRYLPKPALVILKDNAPNFCNRNRFKLVRTSRVKQKGCISTHNRPYHCKPTMSVGYCRYQWCPGIPVVTCSVAFVAWIRRSTGSHLLIRCYTLPGLESIADYSLPYKQRATEMEVGD